MKHAVEGIYNEGKITINEKVPVSGKSKVLVIFLEDYKDNSNRKERLLKTFGSWVDNRDAESIINDVYSSRESRKEDFSL
ncbi:UNVERIFIED_CONTAM: hypothetical protein Cloal_2180 [Acetivibrio alkalicellulosi]